jgi:hypothetical protein
MKQCWPAVHLELSFSTARRERFERLRSLIVDPAVPKITATPNFCAPSFRNDTQRQ